MRKKWFTFLVAGVMMLQLCSCGMTSDVSNNTDEVSNETVYGEAPQKQHEEHHTEADYLTLEQKVGQLFIVRPDSLLLGLDSNTINEQNADGVTAVDEEVKNTVHKYYVGGVCLFAKNIVNPNQVIKFNSDLQSVSEIPMFITVDEEGGIVARLANNSQFKLPKYKSATAVASSGKTEDALKMGQTIGGYLKKYGFNMDFAPDADVNTNPSNPVIGTRAFSSDAKIAASMVEAAAEGLRENGILPTLKHFPGHGDTKEDSHSALAVTHKTLAELEACEFLPFEADGGMHCVMVGHIAAPNVTGNMIPATLSPELIDLIPDREDTLIITDSLSMQAISDTYTSGEAAVQAFLAGCDMLLMPVDFTAAYDAVLQAVRDGVISEERLDESVNKILSYKHSVIDFDLSK